MLELFRNVIYSTFRKKILPTPSPSSCPLNKYLLDFFHIPNTVPHARKHAQAISTPRIPVCERKTSRITESARALMEELKVVVQSTGFEKQS